MQGDVEETRECPDCGRTLPASQALCDCGTAVPVTIRDEVPAATHALAVQDRIYLAVSSSWILLCLADVIRASLGATNNGFVFSTRGILLLGASLHGAIGVLALHHEEWSKSLSGMLCFVQIAAALGGGIFALVWAPPSGLWITQGYFALLILLSIAQIVVLCDSN